MNEADRFARIEALFNAAVDLPSGERDAFLEQECGGDRELEARVRRLLERDSVATRETPLGALAAPEAAAFDEGTLIGAYRVKRELSRGGMGTVYLASRADDAYEKVVAIKVVQNRLSGDLIERFRTERQILAELDHPNIARLLDGGASEGGLPYVVMEYVDGLPLDEFCDRQELSIRERLDLFQGVCAAVQFAHRNLVVHRDIKPHNILVTDDGTPKLLDFGIAKLLTGDLADPAGLTVAAGRRMTPGYASPEQVRGEPITTASDVYSLGVLLFELLTGHPPYRVAGKTAVEIERTICDTLPPLPSECVTADIEEDRTPVSLARARRSTPERLRNLIKGDLDNIVMKALRKEPDRRYPTAEALAEDIVRYLTNQPVAARQDTWSYRTSKFAARNRVALAAAAIVFVSIVAAAGVSVNYAISENRQRALAEQRFEDVRELATTLLYDVHDSVANEGPTATRDLLVSTGTEYLNALGNEALDDPALKQDIARGYIRLAQIQGDPSAPNRGNSELAMTNVHYGMSLVEDMRDQARDDVTLMLIAAEGHQVLAGLLRHEGQELNASIEHYDEAVRLRLAVSEGHPDLVLNRPRLDTIYWSYALAMVHGGRHTDALELYGRVVTLLGELVRDNPDRRDLTDRLLSARAFVGDVHQQAGDFDRARELLEPLVGEIEQVLTERPPSNRLLQTLGTAKVNLGRAYDALGEREFAEEMLLDALALNERVSAADPENVSRFHTVALTHHFLGRLYDNMGDHARALAEFERMLQINREIAGHDPESQALRRDYAVALDMTGSALRKLGRNDEALTRHRLANDILMERARIRPDDYGARRGAAVSLYFLGLLQRDMAELEAPESVAWTEHLQNAIRDFGTARDIMIRIRDAGHLPPGDDGVIDMLSGEADATQAILDQGSQGSAR